MPSEQIQWFPGHMAKTRRMITENLKNVVVDGKKLADNLQEQSNVVDRNIMNISDLLKSIKNQLEVSLPLMEGREKGSLVLNTEVTIKDWGYLTDHEKNDSYVAFIIEEDNKNFYFGGSVSTDKFKKIDAMGEDIVAALKANGMPVVFEEKKSKSTGMRYHDMIIKA